MTDSRCPNCENDISDVITTTVRNTYTLGSGPEIHAIVCPHCGTELSISIDVTARLSRSGAS
jgi:hypothetical protein